MLFFLLAAAEVRCRCGDVGGDRGFRRFLAAFSGAGVNRWLLGLRVPPPSRRRRLY